MNRSIALACFALAALVGCGDKTSATASATASAAPLEPFTGKLTGERILSAKDLVEPLQPWGDALAILESKMGKATRVKDAYYEWAVVEGTDCTYVQVEKSSESDYVKGGSTEAVVGAVMNPQRIEKGGPIGNYSECLGIAGVSLGPPEDPNAKGPPTDGAALGVATFAKDAVAGRSKWKGQRVKIAGHLKTTSTMTMTSGSTTTETHNAILVPSADEGAPEITCTLRAGEEKPELSGSRKAVAEGRVAIRESMTLGGDASIEASLEDCAVTVSAGD